MGGWSGEIFLHTLTCSGDDLYPLLSFGTHNSSLDSAMEWKLRHSAPLEMLFPLASLLDKVKIFRFWPKTMDYSPWLFFFLGVKKKL